MKSVPFVMARSVGEMIRPSSFTTDMVTCEACSKLWNGLSLYRAAMLVTKSCTWARSSSLSFTLSASSCVSARTGSNSGSATISLTSKSGMDLQREPCGPDGVCVDGVDKRCTEKPQASRRATICLINRDRISTVQSIRRDVRSDMSCLMTPSSSSLNSFSDMSGPGTFEVPLDSGERILMK